MANKRQIQHQNRTADKLMDVVKKSSKQAKALKFKTFRQEVEEILKLKLQTTDEISMICDDPIPCPYKPQDCVRCVIYRICAAHDRELERIAKGMNCLCREHILAERAGK